MHLINVYRNTFFHAKAEMLEMCEMHAFHFDLISTLSWELVTEGYQGRSMKCVIERPSPGMLILWFLSFTFSSPRDSAELPVEPG